VTEIRPCEVCHIGTMHPMRSAYTTWCEGQFIVVPNIDAWLCDVCGEFWHEPELIARVEVLLGNKPGSPHMGRYYNKQSEPSVQSAPSPDRSRSA
jgi:YgiT-type zinc finger domain-containing protein